jgi:nicotinate-nucleotide adenylyltransferase
MRRPGNSVDLSSLEKEIPGLSAKVRFIDALLQDVSSSEIRRRAASGEPYRYYLPAGVYQYIVDNNLYQP